MYRDLELIQRFELNSSSGINFIYIFDFIYVHHGIEPVVQLAAPLFENEILIMTVLLFSSSVDMKPC